MRIPTFSLIVFCLTSQLSSAAEARLFISAGTIRSTTTYVHFYLEDSSGQRTGRLPNGIEVAEIPGTAGYYGVTADGNLITNEPGPAVLEFHTSNFPTGQFKLVLVPVATTSYWLQMSIVNLNGARTRQRFSGYALNGATTTITFEHNPTGTAPAPIVKVVSLSTLQQSLQVAAQLQEIGDAAFVSRLDKMLVKAEGQIGKGQKKQAADTLDQFTHRLESAFKKEPDPNADDDPSDKKSASNMKRFIAKQARDALQADSRTLITSLGETPKK